MRAAIQERSAGAERMEGEQMNELIEGLLLLGGGIALFFIISALWIVFIKIIEKFL